MKNFYSRKKSIDKKILLDIIALSLRANVADRIDRRQHKKTENMVYEVTKQNKFNTKEKH